MYRDDCRQGLDSDSMVIPGHSGLLQMVDHTLIDSPCYKGHCKVMCVSSPEYFVINGNKRGACQILPDPDWKAEDQRGATTMNNQSGDMSSWTFKEMANREETKNRESKKKPAQLKKNDNHDDTQDVKVQEGTTDFLKESVMLDQFWQGLR